MAKSIPTIYTDPSAANLSRGEIILQADVESILAVQNYHFAHRGARLRGVIFDTPWETTSTSYVVDPTTATDKSLDTIACASYPLRGINVSGTTYARYSMAVYGDNVDVRCTVKRLDTGATVSTSLVVSIAGGAIWEVDTLDLMFSTYATIPLEFTFDAKWSTDGTEASIWQIELHETVITAVANLPVS